MWSFFVQKQMLTIIFADELHSLLFIKYCIWEIVLSTVTCFDSFECFLSQLLGVPTSWAEVKLAAKSKDAAAWKSGRTALENILYSETITYKVNIMLC